MKFPNSPHFLVGLMLVSATAALAQEAPAPDAAAVLIYQRACLSCHGAEGQGKPGLYPPLAGVDWVTAPRPDRLIRIVLHGIVGPIEVNGQPWATATPFMPGHAPTLKDEEIATLLTWLRRSMGNKAPPVAVETVAAIRAASAERKSMWTAAELSAIPDR